jgi:hypothetical protein
MPHDGHSQITYFGIYSSAQTLRVTALLSSLGANFYFEPLDILCIGCRPSYSLSR